MAVAREDETGQSFDCTQELRRQSLDLLRRQAAVQQPGEAGVGAARRIGSDVVQIRAGQPAGVEVVDGLLELAATLHGVEDPGATAVADNVVTVLGEGHLVEVELPQQGDEEPRVGVLEVGLDHAALPIEGTDLDLDLHRRGVRENLVRLDDSDTGDLVDVREARDDANVYAQIVDEGLNERDAVQRFQDRHQPGHRGPVDRLVPGEAEALVTEDAAGDREGGGERGSGHDWSFRGWVAYFSIHSLVRAIAIDELGHLHL